MSPSKSSNLKRMVGPLALISCILALSSMNGCMPPPPIEEETKETAKAEPGQQISESERALNIAKYRSFAYQAWKNKDYEKACRHIDTVRVYDIHRKEKIYRSWADCFLHRDMLDSALLAYEEGVVYFPDDDYLHNSLAIMYYNEGRLDAAIEQAKEAVRIKPDEVRYVRFLKDLYLKVEDYDHAIETLRRLTELLPDDPNVNQELLNLIRAQRDPEEYLKSMAEAVQKFPDDPQRRINYASALLEQGQNRKAADEFEAYLRMKPDDADGWRGLAKARDNLGRYARAIAAHCKVIDLEPGALREMVAVGQDYLALNNWVQARAWAQKALRKNPKFGPGWMLMGDIYNRAADVGAGETPKYNDKLVFVIAYGLYEKAAHSSDPRSRSQGDREMQILKNGELVPSAQDRFMHKNTIRPSGSAYEWINLEWPEVKYIDEYLKRLDLEVNR